MTEDEQYESSVNRSEQEDQLTDLLSYERAFNEETPVVSNLQDMESDPSKTEELELSFHNMSIDTEIKVTDFQTSISDHNYRN